VVARAVYAGTVESGLVPGDVIHSLNRTPIRSLADLRSAVREVKVGDSVVLQIERQGGLHYLAFDME
jgi:serine protease Do